MSLNAGLNMSTKVFSATFRPLENSQTRLSRILSFIYRPSALANAICLNQVLEGGFTSPPKQITKRRIWLFRSLQMFYRIFF